MSRVIITNNTAQAIVLNEILRAKISRTHSGMTSIPTLRSRLQGQMSRKAVDGALIALAESRAIVLQRQDDALTLKRAEREALLLYKGTYYGGVNLWE